MPELDTPHRRRSPVIKKLEAAAPAIRSQFGLRKIGIFGSFARGEETRTSDVDVLVDFAEGYATLRNFVGLADRLEALLRRKVDLITVEGIDKYIRNNVEAEVIWFEG
ncbi:nucleotidyltransferase family protein [Methanoregula sp.]|uniref:nucleotidyltransferase family protein n=1 Tax=Methanoregula sp. TaxID=2052170 RepID=UPI000CBF2F57|nr:nucleotidyltransferase family protein [Methanoregula sp.]PKG31149.1 MAG: nucleotidyltransferase [Methanoregula sp.]